MKDIFKLFFSATLSLLTTSSAFAMHAYRSAQCEGLLPNGQEIKMAYSSGSYPMALKGKVGSPEQSEDYSTINTVDILGTKLSFDADSATDLLLEVRRETQTRMYSSSLDQCWKEEGTEYKMVVEVKSIKADLETQLGLRKGSNILLHCGDNLTYPAGNCQY